MGKTKLQSSGNSVSGEPEGDNEKQNDQMRASLSTTVRIVASLKEYITPDHMALMRKTPFYLLFNSICDGRLKATDCTNCVSSTFALMERFNPNSKRVSLGWNDVGFNLDYVKYIFGIVDGKEAINLCKGNNKEWEFKSRVFPDADDLIISMLKVKLEELIKLANQTSIEDSVRVICLLLIDSCFFSNTSSNMTWGYVQYVENLDKMRKYDCSGAILDMLVASMIENHQNPFQIKGCTPLLNYWLCEHSTIINPKKTWIGDNLVPRVVKWHIPDLRKIVNVERIRRLTREEVHPGKLKPVIVECEHYRTMLLIGSAM